MGRGTEKQTSPASPNPQVTAAAKASPREKVLQMELDQASLTHFTTALACVSHHSSGCAQEAQAVGLRGVGHAQ